MTPPTEPKGTPVMTTETTTNPRLAFELALEQFGANNRSYKSAGDWTGAEHLADTGRRLVNELNTDALIVDRDDVVRFFQLLGRIPGAHGIAPEPKIGPNHALTGGPRGLQDNGPRELELAVNYLEAALDNLRVILAEREADRRELETLRRDIAGARRVLGVDPS